MGVSEDCVRLSWEGEFGVGYSPRRAALREAVSLLEGVGDDGSGEVGCDMRHDDVVN